MAGVLPALIIVFREVFEAGLVVGIVLAVTQGVPHRGLWIAGGVAAGVLGSCLMAGFAGVISQAFAGSGQELVNATVLMIAVVMLTWHNVWMARHGRELAAQFRAAGEAVAAGSKSLVALAVVVCVAVLREGFEVVMFLYGVLATQGATGFEVFVGGVAGMLLGALVCGATYFGMLTIPQRFLFSVTSIMIAFLAAGMAAQAIGFLEQANVVLALDQVVWDSSWLLSDSSILGRVLRTLVGYNDRPTLMQLTVYCATLAVMFTLMKLLAPPPRGRRPVTRLVQQSGVHHRLAYRDLRLFGRRHHRQAQQVLAAAEQRHAVFDRRRARFHEQIDMQRGELVLQRERSCKVAAQASALELGAQPRRHVGRHRDAAVAAVGHEAERGDVLARRAD